MNRTVVKLTGKYQAIDDNGIKHNVSVFTNFIKVSPLSGDTELIEGLKSHKMQSNGNHVNVNDDGTLLEVVTGRNMRPV